MAEVVHHSNDVILNITKIEANVHARSDLVVLIAALGEAPENIGLASEQAHKAHGVLAAVTNLSQELMHVVSSRNEHFILDLIRLVFNLADSRREGIDNVVTVKRA
jgi:hypothetical protein